MWIKTEKYLFNRIVEKLGHLSAVAFGRSAEPEQAVKKGVGACMTEF